MHLGAGIKICYNEIFLCCGNCIVSKDLSGREHGVYYDLLV